MNLASVAYGVSTFVIIVAIIAIFTAMYQIYTMVEKPIDRAIEVVSVLWGVVIFYFAWTLITGY
jgi:hypothetical protein